MDQDLGMMVCVTRPCYAECMGPDDPFCGRCRFSTHGCGGAPTREEYIEFAEGIATASERARTS